MPAICGMEVGRAGCELATRKMRARPHQPLALRTVLVHNPIALPLDAHISRQSGLGSLIADLYRKYGEPS